MTDRPRITVKPPPGRPCWVGQDDSPLRYLGWGRRDFCSYPVGKHRDVGVMFYLVTKGDLVIEEGDVRHPLRALQACIVDRDCFFGITHGRTAEVEILVWVWRDAPADAPLRPPSGGLRRLTLSGDAPTRLLELHRRCRDEVERADASTPAALSALKILVETELARAARGARSAPDLQWERVKAWVAGNLAIHAPVPALCDYLRISPSTLNRLFRRHAGLAPGVYFREAKRREAERLIHNEGWPVKTAAFHLGYRHATDLSRALTGRRGARSLKTPAS